MTTTITPSIVSTREYDIVTWAALADTNIGGPVDTGPYTSVSIQGAGNGTSFVIDGSNDGGTTWSALGSGITCTFSSSATPVTAVTPLAQQIEIVMTGGTASTVTMYGKKQI